MSSAATAAARGLPGSPVSLPVWQALSDHHKKAGQAHLRDRFAADAQRDQRYTREAAGLYLDDSKNRVDDQTPKLVAVFANECGLAERIQAMFRGDAINATEIRSVLHVAPHAPANEKLVVDGVNVVVEVHAVLARMAVLADAVRSGRWLGHSGKRTRKVVSIGGSDLGPVMTVEALRHYSQRDLLMTQRIAPGAALAFGKTAEEVAAKGAAPGPVLHRVFAPGVVWGIDSFDRWGVELENLLAQRALPELDTASDAPLAHDSATNALIRHYRRQRSAGPAITPD